MSKHKNNLALLYVIGIAAALIGHALNLYVVRPYVDSSTLPDLMRLLIICLAIAPAIVIFAFGLSKAVRARNYLLASLNVFALVMMALLVFYFSYPILHTPRQLRCFTIETQDNTIACPASN